ncbi:hypothetical protein BDC45DRAFT_152002 [Circinella umbellata]|nr:hypothetical protein BDC45DRAFT_152002 [Circinella umbellata]
MTVIARCLNMTSYCVVCEDTHAAPGKLMQRHWFNSCGPSLLFISYQKIFHEKLKKSLIARGPSYSFLSLFPFPFTFFYILRTNMSFRRGGCYKCGEFGHQAKECSKTESVCYNCNQEGHMSKDW